MIEEIKKILIGIDQTELENPEGWWETSAGAEFGANKLKQIAEALAQPEQEPVAWRGYNWGHSPDDWVYRDFDDPILDGNGNNVGQPLYTTPPHRKPLTDGEIDKLPWGPHEGNPMTFAEGLRDFARAIEAAHGIKEST